VARLTALLTLDDQKAHNVFDSLVAIRVGDGARTLFWHDRWINGMSVSDYAPKVRAKVATQCKNRRMVQHALVNHRWLNDVYNDFVNLKIYQLSSSEVLIGIR
jgi:hypothetical protein